MLRAIAPLLPPAKRRIIYNPMEHPSLFESLRRLEKQHGLALVPMHPDRLGVISPSAFPEKFNALLMGQLDYHGVSVAAESACNTGENAPSHVLTAMGLSTEEARLSLRISFPHGFSSKDLRYVLRAFKAVLPGKADSVSTAPPSQMTPEDFLAPDIFVIDLRRKSKPDSRLFPMCAHNVSGCGGHTL